MTKPIIGVSLGDPAGIGPEIVIKSFVDPEVFETSRPYLVGDAGVVKQAIEITGLDCVINVVDDPREGNYEPGIINMKDLKNIDIDAFHFGEVNAMCGKAEIGRAHV